MSRQQENEVTTSQNSKRTMRLSIIDGAFLSIYLINSGGPLIIAYALLLGAKPWMIGLLAAMPFLSQIASLFTPWIAGFFPKRRFLGVPTAVLSRLLWWFGLFAPFIFSPQSPQVGWLVLFVGLSNLFGAVNTTVWYEWISCVVPGDQCGSFFSKRNAITTFVGTGLNLFLGYWLDSIGTPLWAMQLGLSICAVLGLVAAGILYFYHEPHTPIQKMSLKESITDPLKDRNFIKVLIYAFWTNFGLFMLIPTTSSYFIQEVRLNFTQISIWLGITAVSLLILANNWGRTVSKAGSKPALSLSTMGLGVILPILYITTNLHNLIPIYIAAVFEALILGVVNPAIYQLTFKSSAGKYQFPYMALYLTITGLGGALGALSFGPLYSFLNQFNFAFLGIDWNGYRLIFVVNIFIKLTSLSLLQIIYEEKAWTVKKTAKYILATIFRRKTARSIDENE